MLLGSSTLAPRHRYIPRVLNPIYISWRASFGPVLPPRRLLPGKFKARRIVCQPTAAQRTAVAADEVPEPNEEFPSESLGNFRSSQPRRAVLKPAPTDVRKVLLAILQLSAVVALLILLPAWIVCKCIPARVWQAVALYSIFFGFGGLRRTLKHGKLSSRKHDAQVSTGQGKRAIILFVLLVVAGHWEAIFWYGTCLQKGNLSELYTLPGVRYIPAVLLPAALALHVWATETLGKAYDRLVVPDKLVRSGPYAWCQHPIYTSYMLLFSGFMLWFGSEECCVLLLYVCLRYYKGRIATEARLLQQAFGNEYIAYKEHTGSFLPRFF